MVIGGDWWLLHEVDHDAILHEPNKKKFKKGSELGFRYCTGPEFAAPAADQCRAGLMDRCKRCRLIPDCNKLFFLRSNLAGTTVAKYLHIHGRYGVYMY